MMIFVVNARPNLLQVLAKANSQERLLKINTRLNLVCKLLTSCLDLWFVDLFLHNDLKGDNIMFSREGNLQVCDFGHSTPNYSVLT
jgi:thiamine kinase-like enzyme